MPSTVKAQSFHHWAARKSQKLSNLSKGTKKYIKAEQKSILLEENNCSNTMWKFEKTGDYYKIIPILQPEYSISVRNNTLVLDKEDTNNLFNIEKNIDTLNGTYYIKYNDPGTTETGTWVKFFTANEESLELKVYSEVTDDASIEFYLELEEDLINDVIKCQANVKSLDEVILEDGKKLTLLDKIADRYSNSDQYLENISLQEGLKSLTDEEYKLINLRYFEDKTQSEIAQFFGTNQVQISRNEKKILKKLKNNLCKPL